MKKAKQTNKYALRPEYTRSDFPKGFVRGKYAEPLRESPNVVVLEPEVARAFPNQEAVNSALLSLIEIAEKTTRRTSHSAGRVKRRCASQLAQ